VKDYIKNGFKVFVGYGITLIVFGVFIYVFLSLAKNNSGQLLPYYSLLMFLMAFAIIYSDMRRLAEKEKKPQYDLHPYPLKGFVYGILGFSPIALLEIISIFLVFESQFANRIRELAVNTLMGPLFFIVKAFNEKPLGYILASLAIPIIAMFGYLAGLYGFSFSKYLKKSKKAQVDKQTFSKSPWNPTNKVSQAPVKKKKKVQSTNKVQ
jgi:hypothetical protein